MMGCVAGGRERERERQVSKIRWRINYIYQTRLIQCFNVIDDGRWGLQYNDELKNHFIKSQYLKPLSALINWWCMILLNKTDCGELR